MSFILEAIKKSEQQRLRESTPQQEVRKRTLFLSSHRSSRRIYWMAPGFLLLLLVLFSGWLFYSGFAPVIPASSPAMQGASQAPSSFTQSRPPEPAPVPHDSVSAPSSPPEAFGVEEDSPPIPAESRTPAAPPMAHGITSREMPESAEREAIVVSEQPKARIRENLPLYLDLSKELRDRIPGLTMSMHYHSSDPGRRLVRINDRLLREGDWLSSELHVVEITSTGAILDFLGKTFVMRSPMR
jgi:general secretion pathway protein B